MPKVPEYNLPRFDKVPYTPQEKIDSRYWRYKKKTPPKDVYKPRTKITDKRLINEDVARIRHIQSIKREEF